jgi:ribosomal protein RSM22 (predicted rRNA methylase)
MKTELTQAIDLLLSDEKNGVSRKSIQEAYLILQKKYADLKQKSICSEKPIVENDAMRIAYLLSRMPATFAVANKVIAELHQYIPSKEIQTLLDLGTGSGAVLWAALNSGYHFTQVTALDQDANMLELAKKLTQYHPQSFWQSVQWVQKNINQNFEIPSHDLVTLSYALIEQNQMEFILEKMWDLAKKVLIIIEPGTTKGFENILFARDFYIKKGGYIAAPCSHQDVCPMKKNNWCHFDERIERTSWQRSLKGASLGFEDEAYSYLIITKFPVKNEGYRILAPPAKRSGHIIFDLCAPCDIKKETVTRKQKDQYKIAKKKRWGEIWI